MKKEKTVGNFSLEEKISILGNNLIFYDLETARDIAECINRFDFEDLKELARAINIMAKGKSGEI